MHEIDRLFPITRGRHVLLTGCDDAGSQGDVATADLATQRVNQHENWLGCCRAYCEGDDAARVLRDETRREWR